MTEQRFLVPEHCPQCGSWICLEATRWMPSALHCGSEHDGGTCGWRSLLAVDPSADTWTVTSETSSFRIHHTEGQ